MVRNRRGYVTSTELYDTRAHGHLHRVDVDYADFDGVPNDSIMWESESPTPTLLTPKALPRVGSQAPQGFDVLKAILRSSQWQALNKFWENDTGQAKFRPFTAFLGALQAEDYQLVPLTRSRRMPRISMLIADDVGLGKTIEAGLILGDLLLNHKARRVLVLCPSSLKYQWQNELREKFCLNFDIVDRQSTFQLKKRLGWEANPWSTLSKVITSYHYLRQDDVLVDFKHATRNTVQSSRLPWDLIIVDEAHNLAPSPFGDSSDLYHLLRSISPSFEHKVFLTATPHNGYTRSFTGLLQELDPGRFTQTSDISDVERTRLNSVFVRRLKRELDDRAEALGRPRKFAKRDLKGAPVTFGSSEEELAKAFGKLKREISAYLSSAGKRDKLVGQFALEVLNKRLLSCPYTFAVSWYRLLEGAQAEDSIDSDELYKIQETVSEDSEDDEDIEVRTSHYSKLVGSWLRPLWKQFKDHFAVITVHLEQLGLTNANGTMQPTHDARMDALFDLIDIKLRPDDAWKGDERLVIFTEYKTSLDYLYNRLIEKYKDKEAIRVLFGGNAPGPDGRQMGDAIREEIKLAFNDPRSAIRILIATDTASEGQNIQESCRYLFHFDIPWNPSKLEQRNGRIDRHGQARDVTIFHFKTDNDADLKFLAYVLNKANAIREDLGSMGEIFDAGFQRRFTDQQDTDSLVPDIDEKIEARKTATAIPISSEMQQDETETSGLLDQLRKEIDLSADTLRSTLELGMGLMAGQPRIEEAPGRGLFRLVHPIPKDWEHLIDETLRKEEAGALLGLAFDSNAFIDDSLGRPVFRPRKDTALMHLGHPVIRQALLKLSQLRYPGQDIQYSLWTVTRGELPVDHDALILLSVEELAINDLREPIHHWVSTLRLPVKNGRLLDRLPPVLPSEDHPTNDQFTDADVTQARQIWLEVEVDVREHLSSYQKELTTNITAELIRAKEVALSEEIDKFRQRSTEVKEQLKRTTRQSLEKERDKLLVEIKQLSLLPEEERKKEDQLKNIEQELETRTKDLTDLLDYLKSDHDRMVNQVIPKRFTLRGEVQTYFVTLEIRLPELVAK